MKKQIKDALLLVQVELTLFTLIFAVISLIDKIFIIGLQLILVILMSIIGVNNYFIYNQKKIAVVYWLVSFIMLLFVIVKVI